MKTGLSTLLVLLGLCAGALAGSLTECGLNIDDVYATCDADFEDDLEALLDGLGADTTQAEACTAVEELLDDVDTCLHSNETFNNCTEDEIEALEYELYEFYNASCVYYDECLLHFDEVLENLEECFEQFNESLNTAFSNLDGESPDFTGACEDFESGLEEVGPCFEMAVSDHWCSDEALFNLTIFYYEYDSFYNDTCGNEFFDEEIFGECDDPVTAFGGLAYCFGSYLYDYEGYDFDDNGYEYHLSFDEDDCSEAYEYIYDTALCAGYVVEEAGCGDDVADALLELLQDVTDEFGDVCGEDRLDDLELFETTTVTTSAADLLHFSSLTMALAAMLATVSNLLQ